MKTNSKKSLRKHLNGNQ